MKYVNTIQFKILTPTTTTDVKLPLVSIDSTIPIEIIFPYTNPFTLTHDYSEYYDKKIVIFFLEGSDRVYHSRLINLKNKKFTLNISKLETLLTFLYTDIGKEICKDYPARNGE
jgi:hypothetical protein